MDETAAKQAEAEVRVAFDGYEAALVGNDVEALIGFFADDPRTFRMMDDQGLYGFDDIAAFRRARDPSDVARALTKVTITCVAQDVVVTSAEYTRTGSGRSGAQSQTWVKRPEGWRIVAAHVSLGA
ncbi:MAG: AtzH-like domain-containing protein [Pseudomonadota bacterium]